MAHGCELETSVLLYLRGDLVQMDKAEVDMPVQSSEFFYWDLQSPSPYNTYKHTGLPPGPISNPGLASLRAALHPARTDYLYFVSDAAGHTRFSVDLKEHAQQAADTARDQASSGN